MNRRRPLNTMTPTIIRPTAHKPNHRSSSVERLLVRSRSGRSVVSFGGGWGKHPNSTGEKKYSLIVFLCSLDAFRKTSTPSARLLCSLVHVASAGINRIRQCVWQHQQKIHFTWLLRAPAAPALLSCIHWRFFCWCCCCLSGTSCFFLAKQDVCFRPFYIVISSCLVSILLKRFILLWSFDTKFSAFSGSRIGRSLLIFFLFRLLLD